MSRRMVAPGVWKEEEPSTARGHFNPYAVQAVVVGAMTPVLSPGAVFSNGSGTEARAIRRAFSIRPENAVCAAAMRYDEKCGRKPGHRDSHRSRTVMDTDAESRRGVAQYIR